MLGAGMFLRPSAFAAQTAGAVSQATVEVPDWLYPRPSAGPTPVFDSVTPLHVPHSRATFVEKQLHNLYFAPDWTPSTHPSMPAPVALGRRPAVYACAYCHMPDGNGRPENASLAGLPAAYIIQQVADIKSHARHGAFRSAYAPNDNMQIVADNATDEEVAIAAAYFASLTLRQRTVVREVDRVPKMVPVLGLYRRIPGAESEPLAGRLLESPDNYDLHEWRDPGVRYTAFVPKGSITRGRAIAARAVAAGGLTCAGCHGPQLHGVGVIPPLAGRSPGYLVRQLLAFKAGTRATPTGAPMQSVANALSLDEMIAVSAYLASLSPVR